MSTEFGVGSSIDELFRLREQRRKLENQAAEIKSKETALESECYKVLSASGIDLARGSLASFSYKKEVVPNVKDWDAVHQFIRDENDFTLLQKRIAVPVWREWAAEEVLVPGTEKFESVKFFLRRVS